MKLYAKLSLLLLLTTAMVTGVMLGSAAGQGEWIIEYTVEEMPTNKLLMEANFETGLNQTYAPLFGGVELNVTFTVEVEYSNPSALLKISTDMMGSNVQDVYWKKHSLDYDLTNYNPSANSITFSQVQGTLVMSCYGRIPTGVGANKPVQYNLIRLTSPTNEVLDHIRPTIMNIAMDEYLNLLDLKEAKLQSFKDSGVAPAYIELYENVIDQAKVLASQGDAENAVSLLKQLNVASEPASSFMEILFLPAIIALLVVAVILGFLFLRTKGKVQYVTMVIEDQIKDLEGLTLRASKIDRNISISLDSVKERLKSLVGM